MITTFDEFFDPWYLCNIGIRLNNRRNIKFIDAHFLGLGETVRERRKFERFSLGLPTRIEVVSPQQKNETFELLTSDVSAGGAFFPTNKPFPTGTQVQLRLILLNEIIRELTGAQGCVRLVGKVIRSNLTGMAIYFDENYDAVNTSPHNC